MFFWCTPAVAASLVQIRSGECADDFALEGRIAFDELIKAGIEFFCRLHRNIAGARVCLRDVGIGAIAIQAHGLVCVIGGEHVGDVAAVNLQYGLGRRHIVVARLPLRIGCRKVGDDELVAVSCSNLVRFVFLIGTCSAQDRVRAPL